jgi:hypothetical protein
MQVFSTPREDREHHGGICALRGPGASRCHAHGGRGPGWAIVLALALLWWTGPARGQVGDDIIVDHPPHNAGGSTADTELIDMLGRPAWQLAADDILLDAPATVRRVTWWGFYHLDNPPTEETMRIRFYDARPGDGLPGEILFEEHFLNPARVATGRRVFVSVDPAEYEFTVDLHTPFHLLAGTPYWLEIVQLGDIGTHFRWEFGLAEITGRAFVNSNVPDWLHTGPGTSDLAFRLLQIPEPGSIWLFVIGVSVLGLPRKEVNLTKQNAP